MSRFHVLLHGGDIIDGERRPGYRADVGVRDDRIVAIGKLDQAEAVETIDVTGRIIAPGFIDVHNHSDGWLLRTSNLAAKTQQGFTTEILMADGISYAPVDSFTAGQWLFYLRALDALRMDEYQGWQSLADFSVALDRRSAQNFMLHVPYANVRSLSCGFGRTVVDDYHMGSIQAEIRRGMEQGAVGLSTGLDYIVQCFATTDELVAACSAMADSHGIYVSHVRYKTGLMTAVREAVEIGRRAGVPVHISHLKAPNPQLTDAMLEYLDRVARHEVDLSFDVYPYQPGSTMLGYLLPYEAWEDGPLAAMGKLHEPRIRRLFRDGLRAYRLNLDEILLAWLPGNENRHHLGKSLAQYVDQSGREVEDALCDLLIEERLAVLCVMNEGDDALVRPFLRHDLYMMGSDGIYHPDGVVHPRVCGSAGRLLGPCVREWRLFSLEDAVYKMTGWPAKRFGIWQRGSLVEGNYADLVVFDAERVGDRATYERPHEPTVGIEHVLVNGQFVVRDAAAVQFPGEHAPGRFLRYRRPE